MKILLINGSPKGEKSNSLRLSRAFVEGLREVWPDAETEELVINDLHVEKCIGCLNCWKRTPGRCFQNDDMAAAIDKTREADLLIWSFPLYYYSLPGSLKIFYDRQVPTMKPVMMERTDGKGNGKHASRYDLSHQRNVLISTCGFFTEDYVLWPAFSQMVLVLLMFCGSCSSSTGGGIKCARILILLRAVRREIRRIAHPRSVEVIKMDGKVVESGTLRMVLAFLGCFMLIVLLCALVLSLDGYDFSVSFSAALACLSNVGPGLEMVGPTGNFSAFSPLSKVVMALCMVTGRLEIFPILVLFSRAVWRNV